MPWGEPSAIPDTREREHGNNDRCDYSAEQLAANSRKN